MRTPLLLLCLSALLSYATAQVYAECKTSQEGWEYLGEQSQTAMGRQCQSWNSQHPHQHNHNDPSRFPDATLEKAGNKCRNPDRNIGGPWCFTTSAVRWEYCNISFCEVCNTTAAWQCVNDFGDHVSQAMVSPCTSLPQFCRSIPETINCVSEALFGCSTLQRTTIKNTLEYVLKAIGDRCPNDTDVTPPPTCVPPTTPAPTTIATTPPPTCKVEIASGCMVNVSEKIIGEIINPGQNNICSEYSASVKCVLDSVATCHPNWGIRFNMTLEATWDQIKGRCEGPTPTTPAPCPTEPPTCNATASLRCVAEFNRRILNVVGGPDENLRAVCDERTTALRCVKEAYVGCGPCYVGRINASLDFVFKTVQNCCAVVEPTTTKAPTTTPQPTPPTTTSPDCKISEASRCLVDISQRIIAEIILPGNQSAICSEVSTTIRCVHESVASCHPNWWARFNMTLEATISQIKGTCESPTPAPTAPPCPTEPPSCGVDASVRCVVEFNERILNVVGGPDGDLDAVCRERETAMRCALDASAGCSPCFSGRVNASLDFVFRQVQNCCAVVEQTTTKAPTTTRAPSTKQPTPPSTTRDIPSTTRKPTTQLTTPSTPPTTTSPDCKISEASRCLVDISQRIIAEIILPGNQSAICSEVSTTIRCVHESVASCHPNWWARFNMTLEATISQIKGTCESPTPAPTAPPCPTEPPSCGVDASVRCVVEFNERILNVVGGPDGDLDAVCRERETAMRCALDASAGCSPCFSGRVNASLDFVFRQVQNCCAVVEQTTTKAPTTTRAPSTKQPTPPSTTRDIPSTTRKPTTLITIPSTPPTTTSPDCKISEASRCLVDISQRIIAEIILPGNQSAICSEVSTTIRCVHESVASCHPNWWARFNMTLEATISQIKGTCESPTPAPTAPPCPTEPPSCGVDASVRCVVEFNERILNVVGGPDGDLDAVCRERETAMRCALDASGGCSPCFSGRVNASLDFVFRQVQNCCAVVEQTTTKAPTTTRAPSTKQPTPPSTTRDIPSTTRKPSTITTTPSTPATTTSPDCKISEASRCLVDISQRIIAEIILPGNQSAICSEVSTTIRCVHESVASCHPNWWARFNMTLEATISQIKGTCESPTPAPTVPPCPTEPPSCGVDASVRCVVEFNERILNVVGGPDGDLDAVCRERETAMRCALDASAGCSPCFSGRVNASLDFVFRQVQNCCAVVEQTTTKAPTTTRAPSTKQPTPPSTTRDIPSTTRKPSTITTTPSTPATTTSPDCKISEASRCLVDISQRIIAEIILPGNQSAICSEVSTTIRCVHESVASCHPNWWARFNMTLEATISQIKGTCESPTPAPTVPPCSTEPPSCGVDTSVRCVVEFNERILNVVGGPDGDLDAVCRERETAMRCALDASAGCSPCFSGRVNASLDFVFRQVQNCCAVVEQTTTKAPITTRAPSTTQPTPPSTTRDIPSTTRKPTTRITTPSTPATTTSPDCKISEASRCLVDISQRIIAEIILPGNQSAICSEVSTTIRCVHESVASCHPNWWARFNMTLEATISQIKGTCESPTPAPTVPPCPTEPPSCGVDASVRCVVEFNERILNVVGGPDGDLDAVCRERETAMRCAMDASASCTPCFSGRVNASLDFVFRQVQNCCAVVEQTTTKAPTTTRIPSTTTQPRPPSTTRDISSTTDEESTTKDVASTTRDPSSSATTRVPSSTTQQTTTITTPSTLATTTSPDCKISEASRCLVDISQRIIAEIILPGNQSAICSEVSTTIRCVHESVASCHPNWWARFNMTLEATISQIKGTCESPTPAPTVPPCPTEPPSCGVDASVRCVVEFNERILNVVGGPDGDLDAVCRERETAMRCALDASASCSPCFSARINASLDFVFRQVQNCCAVVEQTTTKAPTTTRAPSTKQPTPPSTTRDISSTTRDPSTTITTQSTPATTTSPDCKISEASRCLVDISQKIIAEIILPGNQSAICSEVSTTIRCVHESVASCHPNWWARFNMTLEATISQIKGTCESPTPAPTVPPCPTEPPSCGVDASVRCVVEFNERILNVVGGPDGQLEAVCRERETAMRCALDASAGCSPCFSGRVNASLDFVFRQVQNCCAVVEQTTTQAPTTTRPPSTTQPTPPSTTRDGQSTTRDPTTTITTPSTPATTTSPDCKISEASRCLVDISQRIITEIILPGNQSAICSEVSTTIRCVHESVASCHPNWWARFNMTLEATISQIKGTCESPTPAPTVPPCPTEPPSCGVDASIRCVVEFNERILNVVGGPDGELEAVCRERETAMRCALDASASCSPCFSGRINASLDFVFRQVQNCCAVVEQTTTKAPSTTRAPLTTTQPKPPSTTRDVQSTTRDPTTTITTPSTPATTTSPDCKISEASRCLIDISQRIIAEIILPGNQSAICSEVSTTIRCVHESVASCHPNWWARFNMTLEATISQIKGTCESPTPAPTVPPCPTEPPSCGVDASIRCVVEFNERILNVVGGPDGELEAVCRERETAMRCALDASAGCSPCFSGRVNASLDFVFRQVQNCCAVVEKTTTKAPTTSRAPSTTTQATPPLTTRDTQSTTRGPTTTITTPSTPATTTSPACKISEASRCLVDISQRIIAEIILPGNQSAICSEVSTTIRCVHESVASCHPNWWARFNMTLEATISQIKGTCESPTPAPTVPSCPTEPPSCGVDASVRCVVEFNERILNVIGGPDGELEAVCRERETAMRCALDASASCSPCFSGRVNASLDFVFRQVQNCCAVVEQTTTKAPTTTRAPSTTQPTPPSTTRDVQSTTRDPTTTITTPSTPATTTSPDCKISEASRCLVDISQRIIAEIILPGNQSAICSEVSTTIRCVHESVASCHPNWWARFNMTLEATISQIKGTCESPTPAPTVPPCPTEPPSCGVDASVRCVVEFNERILNVIGGPDGDLEAVCRERETAMRCALDASASCSPCFSGRVNASLDFVFRQVQNCCAVVEQTTTMAPTTTRTPLTTTQPKPPSTTRDVQSTTRDPTTTITTPSTPATTTSPDCKISEASRCLVDISQKIIAEIILPGNQSAICSEISTTIRCVHESVASCHPNWWARFNMTLEATISQIKGTCESPTPAPTVPPCPTEPPSCGVDASVRCVVEFNERIINVIGGPDENLIAVCRERETAMKCAMDASASCSPCFCGRVNASLDFVFRQVQNCCAVVEPEPTTTVLPPATTTKKPTSTEVPTTTLAPTTTPTIPTTPAENCKVSVASRCLVDISQKIIGEIIYRNSSNICSERETTITCVQEAVVGCHPNWIARFNMTLSATLREIDGTCESTTPAPIDVPCPTEPPTCGVDAGLRCVLEFNQRILERVGGPDENLREVCLERETALRCVADASVDCSTCFGGRLNASLEFVFRTVQQCCEAVEEPSTTAPTTTLAPTTRPLVCETGRVQECIQELNDHILVWITLPEQVPIEELCATANNSILCYYNYTVDCSEDDKFLLRTILEVQLRRLNGSCGCLVDGDCPTTNPPIGITTTKLETSTSQGTTPKSPSTTPKPPSTTPKSPSTTPKPPSSTPKPPSTTPKPLSTTTVPTAPPTTRICRESAVLTCIADLNAEILAWIAFPENGNAAVCGQANVTIECYFENTVDCNEEERESLRELLILQINRLDGTCGCLIEPCPTTTEAPSTTTIATTTSTTQPPTTTTLAPTCRAESAALCMSNYIEEVVNATGSGDFTGVCGKITEVRVCLETSLVQCPPDLVFRYNLTFEATMNRLTCEGVTAPPPTATPAPTESPECRVDTALSCVLDFSRRYFNRLVDGNITQVCNEQKATIECALGATTECTGGTQDKVNASLGFVVDIISTCCETLVTTTPAPTTTPTTTPTVPTTVPPNCKVLEALSCVSNHNQIILSEILKKEDGNWTYVCGVLTTDTLKCVEENTAECPDFIVERVNSTLDYNFELIGNRCDPTTPAPPTTSTTTTTLAPTTPTTLAPDCKVDVASRCLVDISQRIIAEIISPENQTAVCGMRETTVKCVMDAVVGCHPDWQARFNLTLEATLVQIEDCESPTPPPTQPPCPTQPPTCNTTAGISCVLEFNNRIINVIGGPDENLRQVCSERETAMKCVMETSVDCGDCFCGRLNTSLDFVFRQVQRCCETVEVTTTKAPTTTSTQTPTTTEASTTKAPTTKVPTTTVTQTTKATTTQAPTTTPTTPSPTTTTTTRVPTTTASQCRYAEAIACVDYLKGIIENGSDKETICGTIEATRECITNKTFACDQNLIDQAWDYFNSVVTLEVRQQCYVKINCTDIIEIIEGGGPKYLGVDIRTSPTQICRDNDLDDDCGVSITFDLELGVQPACRKKHKKNKRTTIISQAVFGDHTYAEDDTTCGINVQDSTWQQHNRIPIYAKLDNRRDGHRIRELTIGMSIVQDTRESEYIDLETCEINIRDRWERQCKSVNDPHLFTFDSWNYENHFEGHFVLYKHKTQPFEVQVIYQRCYQAHATCNCGAAVKAGDSVFVVDRCERNMLDQPIFGRAQGRWHNPPMKTFAYVWDDEFTPGVSILSKSGGKKYIVYLPTGTKITIEQSYGHFINVYVTGGAGDYDNTVGLCGTFDRNNSNELTMRNGTVYTGEGQQKKGSPKGFLHSWRVPEAERIFGGVAKTGWRPPMVCECHELEDNNPCGYDYLNEHCDQIERGTKDITDRLPIVNMEDFQGDDVEQVPEQMPVMMRMRVRRQAVDYNSTDWEGPINIDETYDPENSTWGPEWDEQEAQVFCEKYLTEESESGKKCYELIENVQLANDLAGCISDIKYIDNTTWAGAALEALKDQCREELNQNMTYAIVYNYISSFQYIDNTTWAGAALEALKDQCREELNQNMAYAIVYNYISSFQYIDNTTWAGAALEALKDQCREELNQNMTYAIVYNYILSFQYIDNTTWAGAALEALKDHCREELNQNMTYAIVYNYYIDNTTWAGAALEALKDQCREELNQNMTYANGTGADLKDDIFDTMCISECNGNGVCSNGTCTCEDPWGGEDCSVDTELPPVLQYLHFFGSCDLRSLRNQNCNSTMVYGDNFLEDGELTCHMEVVEVNSTGMHSTGDTYTIAAGFVSQTQIECYARESNTKYLIGVSNDGERYDGRLLFNVHDSACHECNTFEQNPTCLRKPNNCIINGVCYASQENHPGDNCLYCNPSNSSEDWSYRTTDGCPSPIVDRPPSGPSQAALIVIIVASVIIGLLIIAALVYRFCFRKRSTNHWGANYIVNEGEPQKTEGFGVSNKIYGMSMYRDKKNFNTFEGEHLSASGSYRSSSSSHSNDAFDGESSQRQLVTPSRPGISDGTYAIQSTSTTVRSVSVTDAKETPIVQDLIDLSQPDQTKIITKL
ncbi:unnamed protein product [Owenia fusiformis]|uniref:Uncharacterized protein n=1 Tax=Owenia fusiformis TaxID=6347 RepID=A0A8S4NWP2_OWEFU|nr:unnamed protein product [Owenia fusiformis]